MKKILKEAMSLKPILNILEDKYLAAVGTANAEFNCSVVDMTRKQIITSKVSAGFHLVTIFVNKSFSPI